MADTNGQGAAFTGALEGMQRDRQGITSDWQLLGQTLLDGVHIKQIVNVLTGYGVLTEVFRGDWALDGKGVDQVFQSLLEPGAISGWHAHAVTTDRLFVSVGRMRIVLYDARDVSPTRGQLNVFLIGSERPALVVVPPGVWHAVQNIGSTPSLMLNAVDQAYCYESPDHYRLPLDTPEIPYRFAA